MTLSDSEDVAKRDIVGVGGGVTVLESDSATVADRDGLGGTLRVAVAVYFSHRHPSALASSAQLPLL